jgi:glycosyltransferase involved in cell wall biosynthesis
MLPSPAKLPLSAVLITCNAAASLEQCLASLDFVDEILVVDSGSQDATLEIARRFGARIIEQTWLGLNGDLLHESAESLSSYLSKQNRYTTLAAEMALAAGKRASFPRIALSPIIRFIKFYFVRQGFRDGLPGLIHIAIGCFNSMMKYSKMLERQK